MPPLALFFVAYWVADSLAKYKSWACYSLRCFPVQYVFVDLLAVGVYSVELLLLRIVLLKVHGSLLPLWPVDVFRCLFFPGWMRFLVLFPLPCFARVELLLPVLLPWLREFAHCFVFAVVFLCFAGNPIH